MRIYRAPSPYPPLFPLFRQYVYTIRDDRRGLFDALIYFLRLLRFLRSDLSVETSDGISWLKQAKDAPAGSKSRSELLSLCSTQPHIKGLFAPLLTTMGETPVWLGIL